MEINNIWRDVKFSSRSEDKIYIVQTAELMIQRCTLMATDPGDLVLDPTCGSGTTAAAAEEWGRRWTTTDTSRVALALARTCLMAARHSPHLLRDSRGGAQKEAELIGRAIGQDTFREDIRQGFVLERISHITLKAIANNAEIDIIQDSWQTGLKTTCSAINAALGTAYQEWQVSHALPDDATAEVRRLHQAFWTAKRERLK
jgi:adenine-specific DNA-methyltransferase